MSEAFDYLSNPVMTAFSSSQFFTGLGLGVVLGIFFMSRKQSKTEKEYLSTGEGDDVKLILVVRNDLKMGKGKAAAQCAHAAVHAYTQVKAKRPQTLQKWEKNGQPKIVVKCESEAELVQLLKRSRELNLITSLVRDAGHTQVAPGSRTVLGVGPASAAAINEVTGHLKLY